MGRLPQWTLAERLQNIRTCSGPLNPVLLRMGCCKIEKKKFFLNHHDFDRFHRSEWDDPGVGSGWYLAYRVILALLMVAGVLAHALSTTDSLGVKWFIFMTNQGVSILTIHYIFYACIVVWRSSCGPHASNGTTLPLLYKISWALQNMSSTVALFISIIYWTLLHPVVVENNLIVGTWLNFLNVFLHGLNTVSYLIDVFVDARPTRIHHFYFALLFGIYYTCFSLVYWAAGGTGRCAVRCWDVMNSTTTALPPTSTASSPGLVPEGRCTDGFTYPCNVNVCDDFIYPITDWTCHPGQAILLIVLASAIGMPLLQSAWWGLHKLRKRLSQKWGGRRFEIDRDMENMTKEGGVYKTTTYYQSK